MFYFFRDLLNEIILNGIILGRKGTGNPYVKLIYDKQKQKTQILKHAEDASWRELFALYVNAPESR